jgi:hypothetical protein
MYYALASAKKDHDINESLQLAMDELAGYCSLWRIGINPKKSSILVFSSSKRKLPYNVSFNGKLIPRSFVAKFLGITFNANMSFTPHFTALAKLARTRMLKLFSIFNATYGPSPHTIIRLYKIYIRTLFEYGAPATCVASPNVFMTWERIQTRTICRTLSIPLTINNNIKRAHANLPTIRDRNLYLARRWYKRAMTNNETVRTFNATQARSYSKDKRQTPHALIRN